jgi:hypothetical protein
MVQRIKKWWDIPDDEYIGGYAGVVLLLQWLGYWLNGPGFISWLKQETFLFSKMSTSALEPTQPPIQWATEFFHKGK